MLFRQLFEKDSSTYTYLLADKGEALLIDPVLSEVPQYLRLFEELGIRLAFAVDTHVHADHITGLGTLREKTSCVTVMGAQSRADCVSMRLNDGETLRIGGTELRAVYTPGHTDDSYSFLLDDRVFTGDTLLIRGTGRTDFQNGDARAQYESLFGRLLTLPDETQVYPAHDYKGWTVSTIGEEKRHNPRLQVPDVEAYITLMANLNLARPRHMDVAVPANLACGMARQDVTEQRADAHTATVVRSGVADVTPHLAYYRVIDVRSATEFTGELGHIPGAELHPLQQLASHAQDWDREQRLLVVCRGGGRSMNGAKELVDMGFRDVTNLEGGMIAWQAQGRPVERAAPGEGPASCG